jgi:sn-glycerol 3-phosphate transport system ATP-binding protein
MRDGYIEQVGPPEDVFQRPQSKFVAGFIGSPPMNLLTGQAEGRRFNVAGPALELPADAPRNGELILGLRPEHARLSAAGEAGWPMQVEMIEMLGAERLVYGRLGDTLFTVRIEGTLLPPKPGDMMSVTMDAGHLHWFDVATGQRVMA